jgi:hypothetical protein
MRSLETLGMVTPSVQRVCNPTPAQFFESFVRTQTPVVLTGTSETKYLLDAMQPASVSAMTRGRQFQFKFSASGAHPNFRGSDLAAMFARESMTFAEFFERLRVTDTDEQTRRIFTGDEHYLWRVRDGSKAMNPDFGELAHIVQAPPYVPSERVYSVWVWFSGKGARTWLHYDNNACHNLNLQVCGAKRCILLPPQTLSELAFYEPGGHVPAYNCSSVDVESAASKALIEGLPHYDALLEQGDLLFIPAHWIHTFVHEGDYNANVNFWWQPDAAQEPLVHDNPVAERETRLPQRQKYQ